MSSERYPARAEDRYVSHADEYEFTPSQERVVSQLSNSLRWVGAPMMSLGSLILIYLIMHAIWVWREGHMENLQLLTLPMFLLGIAVLFMAVGAWCGRAGHAFHQIVTTQGDDIHHLMAGLTVLNQVFSFMAQFVKAMILLTFLALTLNLIWVYTQRDPNIVPETPATYPDTRR